MRFGVMATIGDQLTDKVLGEIVHIGVPIDPEEPPVSFYSLQKELEIERGTPRLVLHR